MLNHFPSRMDVSADVQVKTNSLPSSQLRAHGSVLCGTDRLWDSSQDRERQSRTMSGYWDT